MPPGNLLKAGAKNKMAKKQQKKLFSQAQGGKRSHTCSRSLAGVQIFDEQLNSTPSFTTLHYWFDSHCVSECKV